MRAAATCADPRLHPLSPETEIDAELVRDPLRAQHPDLAGRPGGRATWGPAGHTALRRLIANVRG
ncbi:hypothetical protein ACF073_29250 [Streptomyces sp. NPDC015171]|uniref:hypothetical protein n=1 Tax=Streptomyces sp. NPDC015171 TaxID=3364945 RepID=UPI0036FA701E